MKVARGEVLGMDLYNISEDLPPGLQGRIPGQPKGSKFLRLENNIIQIIDDTREILDIFSIGN